MKQLTLKEVQQVAGGAQANEGYNFSFILTNAVVCALIGPAFFGGTAANWAALGAGYAVLRMTASALDNRYFPEQPEVMVPAQTVTPAVEAVAVTA